MTLETLVDDFPRLGRRPNIESELSQPHIRWWIPKERNQSEKTDSTQRREDTTIMPTPQRRGVSAAGIRSREAEEVSPRVKWLGYVTDILSDGFCAKFQSCDSDRKAIVAEFDFDELTSDDREILKVGAHIVWAVFTERRKGGLENSSTLYLRRLPPPTKSTLKAAQSELNEWFGSLAE